MFTDKVPFKEALKCYEFFLSATDDDKYKELSAEFCLFAHRKAEQGDPDAKKWLEDKPNSFYKKIDEIQDNFNLVLKDHEEKKKERSDSTENKNEKDKQEDKTDPEEGSDDDNPLSFFKNGNKNFNNDYDFSPEEEETESSETAKKKKSKNSYFKLAVMSPKEIDKSLEPLNNLPGLENIKTQVRELVLMERLQQQRAVKKTKYMGGHARHMIFTGNPGTGKTTVARIIAKIFKELGIIHKKEIVEVDRSKLVGPYVGQTEERTRYYLGQAKFGVLFIDEAYALNKAYSYNDYGHDAIETITKYMEDNREDIIVIAAGYPEEMEWFLKMNPGLKSRFPTTIHFDDMSAETLIEIFEKMVKENDYLLEDLARDKIKSEINKQKKEAGNNFANGRMVRNLFEKALRLQAKRVFEKRLSSKKALRTITAADIPSNLLTKKGNVTFLEDRQKD